MEIKTYCLLMMFIEVGNKYFAELLHEIYQFLNICNKNSKGFPIIKLERNWT